MIGFALLLGLGLFILLWPFRYSLKKSLPLGCAFIFAIVVAYQHWGSWSALQQYRARNVLLAQLETPQVLIEKLKQHLSKNPNSARGWYLLGRLYVNQKNWPNARDAFGKAYQLQPDDQQIKLNYSNSLLH